MYRVEKTFKVPVGHRLSHHRGLCKNIHGHNLKIKISISARKLDYNGMVIDFSDIKKIINPILDEFDHACLFNPKDEYAKALFAEGFKVVSITEDDRDPTAEVFAEYLYHRLCRVLAEETHVERFLKLDYVRIWENDDSMAEYTNPGD